MNRSELIPIRVSPEEKETIGRNAKRAAMNVSDFMRDRALGAELAAASVHTEQFEIEPRDDEGDDARTLPNAIQLSTRTGLPKSACQRMIDQKEVRWHGDTIEVMTNAGWLSFDEAF